MMRLLPALLVLIGICTPLHASEEWSEDGMRPLSKEDAKEGKAVYLRECAACHGEKGDGKSAAAAFLDVKPTNFLARKFKFRTTDSGQPPTTQDLLGILEKGLPGTSMPSFGFLSEEERRKVTAYVLSLAELLEEPEPMPIDDPGEPPLPTPALLAKGKAAYEKMQCTSCHGATGKGDGLSAAKLKDDQGRSVKVRDFTSGHFRGGATAKDIYYRILTGLDGTPMPSHLSVLEGEDRWALVLFVLSLKSEPKVVPLPRDPIHAGRRVAARYSCRACHVLDDGKGGNAGPDLRLSGEKLDSDWVKTFLRDPRASGHIYPVRPSRMPRIEMTNEEIDVTARYLAVMGKRRTYTASLPEVVELSGTALEEGKDLFEKRCSECHSLGTVFEIPEAKRKGPDLAHVPGRVDYEWAKKWIQNPAKISAYAQKKITPVTPAQADAIRKFVWKTAVDLKNTGTVTSD